MPLESPTSPAVGVANGTSFPVSPTTNDLFYRTDRWIEYYYDGTRWLSTVEYQIPLVAYSALPNGIAATATPLLTACPGIPGGTQAYLTKAQVARNTATPNDATNFWTYDVRCNTGSIASFTTKDGPDAVGTWVTGALTINSVRTVATDVFWDLLLTKNVSPGNTNCSVVIHYRLVG